MWREADAGYLTCSACADRLGEWLREVRDLYDALDATPIAGEYGHRSGFESRSPARDEVIALTDPRHRATARPGDTPSVPGVLRAWVRQVSHDLGHAAPAGAGHVSGDVATLMHQLPWITRQPWVEEFEGEVRELRTALRWATGTSDHGRAPDGHCPRCRRPVWAHPDEKTIYCACGARYDRRDWAQLKRAAS